ncbi:hypothetical protein [Paenibacillus hamazuiensis]|nr:hypothetical protein [Paenibacillus hamazuiensis]
MKTRIGLVHATLSAVDPLLETFKKIIPTRKSLTFWMKGSFWR